ncbi:MAG: iron-siderophore ABC transporter substrate-binding protein [Pseudonocardia sp.]|nr:iron-siderophore ABC transporter substrate-binding protein [Pseudonocardia sp.]
MHDASAVRTRSLPVRLVLALAALVLGGGLLAACGSEPEPAPAGGGGGGTSGGAFPVTVPHKYGQTEVPAAPQRVVSLGYTDQDAILALGVVPVGIREFTGNQPSATWPWAQNRLGGAQPQVLAQGEVSTEQIAALRPDLIIGISAGLTQAQYDTYSQIAPTIAGPAGFVDYGTPWQDATRMTGQALGKQAEADKLVSDLEARIAQTKAQFPQLDGKTVAGVRPSTASQSEYFVWGPQDLRARFFSALGMRGVPAFDQNAGDQFYGSLSTEQLGQLDQADVVVLITSSEAERTAFQSQPGYPALQVVQENRVVTLDDTEAAALSFSSVLSLPSVLDTLPKKLAAAAS